MAERQPVQSPLTLIMTIKSPQDYEQAYALLTQIQSLPEEQNPISRALTEIGTVHFARFTFLEEGAKLGVFTTYDGDLDTYLREFATAVGPILDQFLGFVDGAPPTPVREHVEEFSSYVKANNLTCLQWYSAYPDLTVLDIKALGASGA
jgi:hypothetical protein